MLGAFLLLLLVGAITLAIIGLVRLLVDRPVALFSIVFAVLFVYDHPRKLEEFTGLQSTRFGMRPVEVYRPPQSWRYVEELK